MFFYFSDDDDFVLVKFLGHRTGFILFSLDHALYFFITNPDMRTHFNIADDFIYIEFI